MKAREQALYAALDDMEDWLATGTHPLAILAFICHCYTCALVLSTQPVPDTNASQPEETGLR